MEISRVTQGGAPSIQQDVKIDIRTEMNQTQSKTTQKNALQQHEKLLDKEEAKKAVEGLNNLLMGSNTHLKFQFHEKLEEYYVSIVDDRTNEVIREIPPKKLLDMVATMREQIGLIIDHKV